MSAVGTVVGQCGACPGAVVVVDEGPGKAPDEGRCEDCGAEYGVPKPRAPEPEPGDLPPPVAAGASSSGGEPGRGQARLGDDIPF